MSLEEFKQKEPVLFYYIERFAVFKYQAAEKKRKQAQRRQRRLRQYGLA